MHHLCGFNLGLHFVRQVRDHLILDVWRGLAARNVAQAKNDHFAVDHLIGGVALKLGQDWGKDQVGNNRAVNRCQVEDLFPDAASRAIGYALVSHLEPTGWITEPLVTIADNMGVDWVRAEQVLMQLQKAEPAGLFARNLTECLKLQVRGPAVAAARLHTLIDNLALIQAGELGALRRRLNCTQEELGQGLRQLRWLDPKPGLGLGGADVMPVRAPDLRAYQDASGE